MSRAVAPLLVALLIACHGDDGDTGDASASSTGTGDPLAPDFAIPDQNPASPSQGRDVSPRDHLGHASGWFFMHST